MSFTKNYGVTGNDWTLVADTGPGVLVQLVSQGPVLVQIAQAKPAPGDAQGVILDSGALEEFVADGMETGDGLYVRSKDNEPNTVAVIGSGQAPV